MESCRIALCMWVGVSYGETWCAFRKGLSESDFQKLKAETLSQCAGLEPRCCVAEGTRRGICGCRLPGFTGSVPFVQSVFGVGLLQFRLST